MLVSEPSVLDTISMLRGIKSKYEVHHGVRITDAALVGAATLSHRYMTERKLPDKAIDLIDEAASRLRLQQESKPEAIQDIDRDIMRLKIEEVALQKENDRNSMDRLSEIRGKLSVLDEEMRGLTQRWNVEKDRLESAKRTKRLGSRVQGSGLWWNVEKDRLECA